ncbi:MAG: alpha-L-rhamnosidase C-terminal domain-containing protein [Bacteroidota bacterium]
MENRRSLIRRTALIITSVLLSGAVSLLDGQHSVFNLQEKLWDASWINHPESNGQTYEVLHFRRPFKLDSVPEKLLIDISGDSRYRFFANGKPVCFGPASSDPMHWNYETVDIAPFLTEGKNVLAVQVWNYGKYRPFIHFSHYTGLIVRSADPTHRNLNTGSPGWLVLQNKAYTPHNARGAPHGMYGAIGTADRINGTLFPFGWEKVSFDDSDWQAAVVFDQGRDPGFIYGGDRFMVPRDIPFMEEKRENISVVRRTFGLQQEMTTLDFPLEIQADTKASILIDMEHLTVGYPELLLSKGKDAVVRITYNESLYEEHQTHQKGNRDSIEGKYLHGYTDVFEHHGMDSALYRPLWNRTFRYARLDIETVGEPLVIMNYYNIFTAYPLEKNAVFESSDPALQSIWDISWHTARLCAMESYMDCPYWEQLQYIGDTRIQALVSMYVSGDDRLVRRALEQFNNSRRPDGLTLSRYPTSQEQVIPTFSLIWVSMIHDYFMLRKDDAFIKQFLPGIRGVLSYFQSKQLAENPLRIDPGWWCFVDWAAEYTIGVPHGIDSGNSSIIAMQYVDALQKAAELFEYYGNTREAETYRQSAGNLKSEVFSQCFDEAHSLLAQTPAKKVFSQHANILGVLTNTIPEQMQKEVMLNVLSDSSLVQATIYFRFYLFQALKRAGLGDLYLGQLDPWHNAIDNGLTTFPESPEPSRSDCHAWSASPNYDFLATVCGIEPATPGFGSVSVQPNLAHLEAVSGKMPHPLGEIKVELEKRRKGLRGSVTLPAGAEGKFSWKGASVKLTEGVNKISIDNE